MSGKKVFQIGEVHGTPIFQRGEMTTTAKPGSLGAFALGFSSTIATQAEKKAKRDEAYAKRDEEEDDGDPDDDDDDDDGDDIDEDEEDEEETDPETDTDDTDEDEAPVTKKKSKTAKALASSPDYLGMLPPSTQAAIINRLDRAAPRAPVHDPNLDLAATVGMSSAEADAFRSKVRTRLTRTTSTASRARSASSSRAAESGDGAKGYLGATTYADAHRAAVKANDQGAVRMLEAGVVGMRTAAERDAQWASVRALTNRKASERAAL